MEWERRLRRKLVWRVDESATTDGLMADPAQPPAVPPAGGLTVFVDEDGRRHRLPADLTQLSAEQRDAALSAMSQALGQAPPDMARMAAIERLTELRAAGKISEEQFEKERTRLTNY
jgi:hypothetical protein